MRLDDFMQLLLTADPEATHYFSDRSENYTIWAEYGENTLNGDGRRAETAVRIQIDRFTKIEDDPVVQAITDMLDKNDIAYEYLVDTEQDTKLIHHIWILEVD
jgi:hypothetical protein